MRTFYSILSLNTKPEINETLSFGMIMVFREKVFFHFSKKKLSVIQKLVSVNTYKAALDYLKMIENTISQRSLNKNSLTLDLNSINKHDRIFSESYIDYLSRYNNNLVSFSGTKILDIEANETVFRSLFKKLIDESAFEVIVPKTQGNRI
jgi:hypothetical protein